MKFGGTSVGSADRIRSAAERVRERLSLHPVVVVSALSGVTDLLFRGADMALARSPEARATVDLIVGRHREVLEGLFPQGERRARLDVHLEKIRGELNAVYTGVQYLGELTPRSRDAIAGLGERMSCEIVAEVLQDQGIAGASVDARRVIVTDETFGRALPLMEETRARARDEVRPLAESGSVPVLGGFIGATRGGISTTLGRGGSDWSASILGATLEADEIQIWTDVDGMMTADPRVVKAARVVPEVSFEEAAELAYFGAKVLHPATIKPAVEKGIPVRIMNSLNPAAAGTRISGGAPGRAGEPTAVAFKAGITVILIAQPRMLMAYGFVARVFEVFDRHRTPVDLIATSEVSVSLTVDDPERLGPVRDELAGLGEVRLFPGMAIVSVVGRGFMTRPGLASRIFQSLREINIVMISFGASDVNISFVVREAEAPRAIQLLHRDFFEAG